jgi:DNA-directed RNA polymerase specialized sigma24 family protein
MSRRRGVTGLKPRVFERYAERYVRYVVGCATRISKGDGDFRDDLVQEGLIALWRFDRSRVRGRGEATERAYVKTVVLRSMLMYRRRMRFT